MDKIYKIRDKDTGLYSGGGSFVRWSKNGKIWRNIGHLKNHLNIFVDYNGLKEGRYPYRNAEIVEIEVNYDECFTISVDDFTKGIVQRMAEWRKQREQDNNERQRERELKQLQELKNKYEL